MSELKPCPCCGSNELEIDFDSVMMIHGKGHQNGYIDCSDCGVGISIAFIDEDNCTERLVSAWNNRPHENKLKADAVREAVKEINWSALTKPQQAKYALVYLANKLEKGEL